MGELMEAIRKRVSVRSYAGRSTVESWSGRWEAATYVQALRVYLHYAFGIDCPTSANIP